jgi:hypothetical protein
MCRRLGGATATSHRGEGATSPSNSCPFDSLSISFTSRPIPHTLAPRVLHYEPNAHFRNVLPPASGQRRILLSLHPSPKKARRNRQRSRHSAAAGPPQRRARRAWRPPVAAHLPPAALRAGESSARARLLWGGWVGGCVWSVLRRWRKLGQKRVGR